MNPSLHTVLINSVIGFCKKNQSWIHPLDDLGYTPQLIEQTIGMKQAGERVKPDVVVTSNRLIHSIVFECKGGETIDHSQILRYEHLRASHLLQWIDVYDRKNYSHDVCILIWKTSETVQSMTNLPILSLSDSMLEKKHSFSKQELNEKFSEPLSINDRKPPISYYPFSTDDDRRIVVPHVLRGVCWMLSKKTGQIDAMNPDTYVSEEAMKRIHKMWNILSRQHQNSIKKLVKNTIEYLFTKYPNLKNSVSSIQTSERANTSRLLSLNRICNQITQAEDQANMDDFL